MYVLFDTFNKSVISRHRSIKAAVKSKQKFNREFYRNNTSSSYIPMSLMVEADGEIVAASDKEREEFARIECCE